MLPSYTPPYSINMISVRRPLRPVGAYGYYSPTVPQLVRSPMHQDAMNIRKRPAPVSCDAYGYPIPENSAFDQLHMKRTGPFNEPKPKKLQPKFTCETCGIDATSQAHLDSHLNGSKHLKKLENLRKENSKPLQQVVDTNNQQGLEFFCFVCHLDCGSANQYNLHVQGRKHKNKLKSIVIKQKLEQMPASLISKGSFFNEIKRCYADEFKSEEDVEYFALEIVKRENELTDAFQLENTVPRMKEFYSAVPIFNPSTLKENPDICKHQLCLRVRSLKFYESFLIYQIEDKKHLVLTGSVHLKMHKKTIRRRKIKEDTSGSVAESSATNTTSLDTSLENREILPSSGFMKTDESA